jgi:hypothetical protein
MVALTTFVVKHESRLFLAIGGVVGVPLNGEVAARSPTLAAGRTDARNGPACVGFIDQSNFL